MAAEDIEQCEDWRVDVMNIAYESDEILAELPSGTEERARAREWLVACRPLDRVLRPLYGIYLYAEDAEEKQAARNAIDAVVEGYRLRLRQIRALIPNPRSAPTVTRVIRSDRNA